jgi:uncharacterized pyridoxal phosphate-containing UPF0001 family protein
LFDFIDSVDSIRLAREISNKAVEKNKTVHILIQINISDNPRQGGVSAQDLSEIVEVVNKLPNIVLSGFMAIAPIMENKEDLRPVFKKVKELHYIHFGASDGKFLSLGMTGDYEIAVEEGSTMPRIGGAIFDREA